MYTWTDEQGDVHLSDIPPEKGKAKVLRAPAQCGLRSELPIDKRQNAEVVLFTLFAFIRKPGSDYGQSVPPHYQNAITKLKAEIEKCNGGDKKACACLESLSESGGQTFVPTGDFLEEPKSPPSRLTVKKGKGGKP